MGESIMGEALQNMAEQKEKFIYLYRVQIPKFRVLNNIDIIFEPDLTPKIFPLGSLNGGGKSTLLQLVFMLLFCFENEHNIPFLQNLINDFPVGSILAIIHLIVNGEKVTLEFNSTFINEDKFFHGNYNNALLKEKKCFTVCEYGDSDHHQYLRCKVDSLTLSSQSLTEIAKNIFLASPITQSFLFVNRETRGLSFKAREAGEYYREVEEHTKSLANFFAYDVIDLLLRVFTRARDDDFRFAIANGTYGNSYQKILKDLENVLGDKRVNIDMDFDGVGFSKEEKDGHIIQLYPEDLSHGELKRLSIFVWLKFNKIENSIVLMDEIEIALHPDWQYQIVRDLETWAPSNQYILATHSYELCHALTPAHVKEISPRLLKK
jgi:predicted ATPase